MYDVITIGSGLVDASIPTGLREEKGIIQIYAGSKIPIKRIIFSSGGGGINTATCVSKLGLKAAFLGKIGSGYNGEIILRELRKNNVKFLGIKSKEHTGYSIILKPTNNNRAILSYKGASDNLRFSEINLKNLKAKWFHLASMNDQSFETQKKLVDYAMRNNIKISFNPGISKIKEGLPKIRKIIRNSSFLSMNKYEAETLLNSKKDLAKKLHKLGSEIVCITNGENQGQLYDGTTLYTFTPRKVKPKECTGAGDAFASTFISSLIKFNDIEKSLKLAIINSQAVLMENGATGGLLSMNQLLRKLSSQGLKIKKESI